MEDALAALAVLGYPRAAAMAALAGLLVDEYAKRYLPEDTARFAYLLSRLKKSMTGLLCYLRDEQSQSSFKPVACELKIGPGEDAVLQFPPTYGMYAVSAETNGAEVVNLVTSLDRGWLPDVAEAAKVLEERTDVKLVFACSPGNPTGTLIPVGMLRKLAELTAGRALLVIDEAYIEFTPANTAVELLKDYPHVVIIRTLSKAFALAGLRCGFLLSSPAVIGMLRKVIAPYPIPVPCADIAAQALSPESVSLMHRRAAQCVMRKCELEVALEDLDGVEAVYPSASNFLLVRFVDAARVFTALRDRGIILRDQSRQPTLENCIRITVGTKDENERLLTELEEILKEAA